MVFVGMVVAVISSLGAPLIPAVATGDQVSLSAAQWSLTVSLLVSAAVTPRARRVGLPGAVDRASACRLRLLHMRRVLTADVSGLLAGAGISLLISLVTRLVQTPGSSGYGLRPLPWPG